MLFSKSIRKSLVLLVFVSSLAPFYPANAADTLTLCINKKTGSLRQLLKGSCKSTEVKTVLNKTGISGPAGVTGQTGPAGPAGPSGVAGTNGTNGLAGKNGNTILSGTVDPIATIGSDGDFYINTLTNKLFGPKATTWPAGISLVGPAGANGLGGVGPAGPQGPSGANSSMIWYSPRDILATPVKPADYASRDDTSTVVNLRFANDIGPLDFREVLDLKSRVDRTVTRALPQGWEKATSFSWNVYWVSPNVNAAFSMSMCQQYSYAGLDLTKGNGLLPDATRWDCSLENTQFPNFTGALQANAGAMKLNIFSFTSRGKSDFPTMKEGGLFSFSLYREDFQNGATLTTENATLFAGKDFTAKIYLLGISVIANF